MCGIAGYFHFKQFVAETTIRSMTEALTHRGPDAEGIFCSGNIALGHRRLSIIDLSTTANQPFTDHSKRFVTVFNGEIYNYNEVKSLLHGYPFITTSDTETLIAAYAKWGVGCIQYFKGMFAFAVWDKQENELCIVRDRMGVKPLYYYLDDEKIVFASEIRAILASGILEPKISNNGLVEFFSYQSIGVPLTIVEGIKQLEAGSYLSVKNREVKTVQYWTPTRIKTTWNYENECDIKQTIRKMLSTSVERRLVSDVPVGAFLSGGIDSSVVVGLMSEDCNVRPNTFNISFGEAAYDESHYASIVAKKFRTNHASIQLSPDSMLDELENALSAMDTPSGDGINTYVVSKAIKNAGISVALSGIGGDELFAGYPIFNQFLQLQRRMTLWKKTGLLRHIGAKMVLPNKFENKKYRLQQILRLRSPNIEEVYPVLRQMMSPSLLKKFLNSTSICRTALEKQLEQHKNEIHQLPLLSQVSVAEYLGYTQHTLLKDTDQMSMAVALEVREPFFDTDLIEYVLGIPDQFKKPRYAKSLLVESVSPLLSNEIVFRPKKGFVFPWELWMKRELYNFCNLHIDRFCERGLVNNRLLKQYWKRFMKNDPAVRWSEVWLFVVLEYWLEKNNVN